MLKSNEEFPDKIAVLKGYRARIDAPNVAPGILNVLKARFFELLVPFFQELSKLLRFVELLLGQRLARLGWNERKLG